MIGQRANLFRKKFPYETHFDSAAGLVPGNVVSLNGVVVGNVLEVNLSGDPRRPHGPRRLRRRPAVGADAPQGHAGLDQDARPARRQVHRARRRHRQGARGPDRRRRSRPSQGAGLEKLLEGSGDLLTDLSAIAKSLRAILGRTEQGEGFLGAITSNSAESEQLGNSLNGALHSLNAMLRRVDAARGCVGKLLIDEKYGTGDVRLAGEARSSPCSTAARTDRRGRPNGQRRDPGAARRTRGKKKVYALVDSLAAAAGNLARVDGELEKGNGAMPILLHDEEFGKEPSPGNLQSFSKQPRLDRKEARRRDRHRRQAHQRSRPCSTPRTTRRRRQRVRARLRWLDQGAAEGGRIQKEYDDGTPAGLPTPTPHTDAVPRSVNLLVTGGAGFIGSHLADRRLARGDRVVVLDDFNDFYDPRAQARQRRREPATPKATGWSRATSATAPLVFRLFAEERFDAVVHLAARAGVRPSLAAAGALRGGQLRRDAAPARGRRRARPNRGSSSPRRPRSTASTRSSRSPRTTRSSARSRPTRRRSGPASSTCSPPITSTACRPSACVSSRSTARASARRWRSRKFIRRLEPASPFRSSATEARGATTRTSTTSWTASRPRSSRLAASRSSTSAAPIP